MKVKKENKDLWEEIANLNEFGILKQASSSSTLWLWAVEQRKLWNAQALIIRQTEKIDGLEEGVYSLLEHNMCLERSVLGFGLMHTTKRNMFLIKIKEEVKNCCQLMILRKKPTDKQMSYIFNKWWITLIRKIIYYKKKLFYH